MEEVKFKFYKVGGYVRDKMLGVDSKDIDYSVVLENYKGDIHQAYELLCQHLEQKKYTIFLKTPDCYTVRVKDSNHEVADFVLARKEVGYDENTRKPKVIPGTLQDDLMRRDFTVNALALDPETNEFIDYCDGLEDLEKRILRTPLDAEVTLLDDPLRIVRGFRFSITKRFNLDSAFWNALYNKKIWEKFPKVVSPERVRDELDKMFAANTIQTMEVLNTLREINEDAYQIILRNITFKPIVSNVTTGKNKK